MRGRHQNRLRSLERELAAAEQAARDAGSSLMGEIEIQEQVIAASVVADDLARRARAANSRPASVSSRQASMESHLQRFRDLQQLTGEKGAAWRARVERVTGQMDLAGHRADRETLVTLVPLAQALAL